LLNYPFYHQRKFILRGFWERLKKIFIWNLTIVVILFINTLALAKPQNWLNFSIIAIGLFLLANLLISFYELFLYYFLQPFSETGQMNTYLYSLSRWDIVFAVIFLLKKVPLANFSVIAFASLFLIILGSIILYFQVVKTFRLKLNDE
jgi:hypothetical protein